MWARKNVPEFDRHKISFWFMYWHRSRPVENYLIIFPGLSSVRKRSGLVIWRREPALPKNINRHVFSHKMPDRVRSGIRGYGFQDFFDLTISFPPAFISEKQN